MIQQKQNKDFYLTDLLNSALILSSTEKFEELWLMAQSVHAVMPRYHRLGMGVGFQTTEMYFP